jgi:hypothetical protein
MQFRSIDLRRDRRPIMSGLLCRSGVADAFMPEFGGEPMTIE